MVEQEDVVVVGGGVVGLCIAQALQRQGREVTVVEKADLGAGCSKGNAGLVVPSHVIPLAAPGVIAQGMRWMLRRTSPFRIKPRLDFGLFSWLWAFRNFCNEEHVQRSIPVLRDLNLASRHLFETWTEEATIGDFGFEPSGLLMLHTTEKGCKKDQAEAERACQAGLDVSVLDRDELDDLTTPLPASVQGGVYYHQDALLHPVRLVEGLEKHLRQKGVALRTDTAVVGFEQQKGTIRALRTTQETLQAKEIVLAAGSWSAPLAQELDLSLPVEPAKGYSVTFEAPDERPAIPFILTETKVSVTPMNGQMRFAGTLELAGFDASVDPHRVKPILETAAEYVPDVDPGTPEEADVWVGFRPCTPDGLPVIGRVPRYDNLVIATGHGMMGVSMAPITGQLVAEIVQGETPSIDMQLLQPARFD